MSHIRTYRAFTEATQPDKLYYHGRNTGRAPFRGNYIFLTETMEYAASYMGSTNSELLTYRLSFPESRLFTVKNRKHMAKIAQVIDKQNLDAALRSAGTEELGWASVDYFSNDEFEDAPDLLTSLGFKGIKLRERPYADSVYVFNQDNVELVGRVDTDTPEMRQHMGDWHRRITTEWNHL